MSPRRYGNEGHKLSQMALGSQTPGVFATNWEVSEVTCPHVAPHLACSESKSGHTQGDEEKCFWDSREHLQGEGCGPQTLQSESLPWEGHREEVAVTDGAGSSPQPC